MQKAREEVKLGVRAYHDAAFEEAAEHFRNAVRLDDHLAVAKLDLANTYGALWIPGVDTPENNLVLQKAIDEFSGILAADPKDVTALRAIAYITFQAKRFDASREYLQRWIQADPSNAEPNYSLAVLEWATAYTDMAQRRHKLGLETPGYEKQPTGPQHLCQQIKAIDGPRIDQGLKMAQAAMEKRAGYHDAMVYASLLYRLKAIAECNPQAYAHDNISAEAFMEQASKTTDEPLSDKPPGDDEVFPVFSIPPPPPPPPPTGKK